MGTFTIPLEVSASAEAHTAILEAVVDTGASLTTLPGALLDQLGVVRSRQQWFRLADGSRTLNDVGDALLGIAGRRLLSPVAFGEPEAAILLGAVTLEIFFLGVDPHARQLVPVDGLRLGKGVTPREP
jgi:predicted aspartyl protease